MGPADTSVGLEGLWWSSDGAARSCRVEGSQDNTSPLDFSLALPVKLGIVREQLWASLHFTWQWPFGLPAHCCHRDSFPSVCNLRKGRVFSAALPFPGKPHCHCHPVLKCCCACGLLPLAPSCRAGEQQDNAPHSSSAVINLPSGVTGEGKQQILLLRGVRNAVVG